LEIAFQVIQSLGRDAKSLGRQSLHQARLQGKIPARVATFNACDLTLIPSFTTCRK
jgi:hypothetical protein